MTINSKPLSIPRNGLVGEWLLDGNAIDTNDGTKNDGTATNVTYANTSVGYQKQAGVFNGSSSYVSGVYSLRGVTTWTVCTQITVGSVSTYQGIYSINYGTGPIEGWVFRLNNDGRLSLSDQAVGSFESTKILELGKKYFVSLTRSGTSYSIFIDGALDSSHTFTLANTNPSGTGPLIGATSTSYGQYYNGVIQSVRIYDRVLSAQEIQSLYLEGKRMIGNYGNPDVMGKIGYVFESFGDDTLWETVAGTAVTRTAGTATTDNLGTARALTNPNYSWGSLTYSAAYSWENSGSGWNLAKNPTGVSATGINRTTTFRTLFLSTEALTADEEAQLAKLCEYSHPVRFTASLPGSLKNGLILDLNGNVSGTTAYDQSGNGNDGTLVNSPTQVRRFQSKGLSFNGSSQYSTVADASRLRLTSQYTLATWVELNSLPSSGNLYDIFYKLDEGTGLRGYEFELWNHGGTQKIFASIANSSSATTYAIDYALPTGKPILLAVSFSSGSLRFFLNGTVIASVATSVTPTAGTGDLYSGYNPGAVGRFLNGRRYRDFVFDVPLTDEQMQHLFYSTYLQ